MQSTTSRASSCRRYIELLWRKNFVRQACFPSLSPLEIPSATMSYYGNWQAIVSLTYRWLTGRETINLDFEDDARCAGGGEDLIEISLRVINPIFFGVEKGTCHSRYVDLIAWFKMTQHDGRERKKESCFAINLKILVI